MTELEDDARDVRTRITLRDHDQLRRTLARIDEQGWDGPTGRSLLEFIRQDMIRPMAVAMGLRGTAACEAEATGWAAAWEALCDPRLVDAGRPWSLVHTAARHALLGGLLAARYASGVHRAWRIREAVRGSEFDPRVMPVDDLTELLEAREDPADGAQGLLDGVLGRDAGAPSFGLMVSMVTIVPGAIPAPLSMPANPVPIQRPGGFPDWT